MKVVYALFKLRGYTLDGCSGDTFYEKELLSIYAKEEDAIEDENMLNETERSEEYKYIHEEWEVM